MELDKKYSYLEKAMERSGVKLFQYLTDAQYKSVTLTEYNKVIVKPVDINKYQTINGFLVELPTTPKMVGKVIQSTIDNINIGDYILYANNYVQYRYLINISDKTNMLIIIDNDDIIMKQKDNV